MEAKPLKTIEDFLQSDGERIERINGKYRVVFSVECQTPEDYTKENIPPFQETSLDLAYTFGEAEKNQRPPLNRAVGHPNPA